MSPSRDGGTLGPNSVILPAARIGKHATVGPVSLVMRGESVPDKTEMDRQPCRTVDGGRVTGADPYLPGHGDVRFQVEHYDLDLEYRVHGNHLEARAAAADAAPLEPLADLALDLHGLEVTSLRVTGADVARWTHRSSRIRIRLAHPGAARGRARPWPSRYRGRPRTMPGPDGPTGWEELTDGVIVAAQPHGAPDLVPVQRPDGRQGHLPGHGAHRPRLPGRLQRQPHGRSAASADGSSGSTSSAEPMATYLATLQIGRYVARAPGQRYGPQCAGRPRGPDAGRAHARSPTSPG